MRNIFFSGEVLEAEKKIISSLSIPSSILMENAGANSTRYILSNLSEIISDETIIITGKGSNAGDGFVIARHMINSGHAVKVVMLYGESDIKADALMNYKILKNIDSGLLNMVRVNNIKDIQNEIPDEEGILIDAIFGVGFKGMPDKKMSSVFEHINDLANKFIVSVDVPSGLHDQDQTTVCIEADLTLSMAVRKFETIFNAGKLNSGMVSVVDIGISSEEFTPMNKKNIYEIDEEDVRDFLPMRSVLSNKYTNGKVFVLTGSPGLTGASYLSCMSALRTGSGAVIAGVPRSVNDILEVKMTEVMTLPLPDNDRGTLSLAALPVITEKLQWADAMLIGPGLSKDPETAELIRKIVSENDCNFVIDADGINAFKDHNKMLTGRNVVLTPHYGEFAALTGRTSDKIRSDFFNITKDFAKKHKLVLVLKNGPTIFTDGNGFYINSTGSMNLATAGTGDVLSGMIASLYSQTGDAMGSVMAGNYMHGKCGDMLFEESGSSSTIAGDLINKIQMVKNELSRSA